MRGRIDNIKLTVLYLRQNRTWIAFTLYTNPIVNTFLEISVIRLKIDS